MREKIYSCSRFYVLTLAILGGGQLIAACDGVAMDGAAMDEAGMDEGEEVYVEDIENARLSEPDTGFVNGVAEQGVVEESSGTVEPEVWCGGGGPPHHCLGRCCSHNHWTDLGVPNWGQCYQMVNDYCEWRGGNCGACWGSL